MTKEYFLLDSGNMKKLEQAGEYRIVRPALNAFWPPSLPGKEWELADAEFSREHGSGNGVWQWKKGRPPEDWRVSWGGVDLFVKPTHFGHLGFFAEQAPNWDFLRDAVKTMKQPKTLNLFAYSGGATIAMAKAGAHVCHLDASSGIIEWAKKNQSFCPETRDRIRWICDDAMKFLAREERRKALYNGIVLDPPSFGRGSQGQVWKIEESMRGILGSCRKILDLSRPYFILLSCHSQGFSPLSLGRILASVFPEDAEMVESGEMAVAEKDSRRLLPAGIYARIFKKQ